MRYNHTLSKAVFALVVAGLVLPIAICLILGLAALLAAMSDASAAVVLRYVAWGGGVVWIVVIVSLVLVQAIGTLSNKSDE